MLRYSNSVEVFNSLAEAEPCQNRSLPVLTLWRDNQSDVLPDGLLRSVTEEPLGTSIPRQDRPIQGLASATSLKQPRMGRSFCLIFGTDRFYPS